MPNQTKAYNWYSTLIKPRWAPPNWIFGPVWSVLYVIIAITFGAVFYKVFAGQWAFVIAVPFILNLIFNFIFTPIQFGLKNNYLAAVDILLLLFTLIWAIDCVRKSHYRNMKFVIRVLIHVNKIYVGK